MASSSWLAVVVATLAVMSACTSAQDAPSPSSDTGPLNLTGILAKGGQFNRLIRLMTETQVADQIKNQLNNSHDGITLFAPTDNAFDNLEPGLLNRLSNQEQVDLLQYHIVPKFYTLENLLTVSNPVRTQYSQDGLNFTGKARDVNVSSTGNTTTRLGNALRADFPLAVYVVDVVLLPQSLFEAKAPASAPPPAATKTPASGKGKNTTDADSSPSPDSNAATATSSSAAALLLFIASSFIASLFA